MTDCLECLTAKIPKHTPVVEGTLWCHKHQVQPPTAPVPGFRHGYYIPDQNALRGDRTLALAAQAYYKNDLGLDSKYAQRYDGVSIYARPDGTMVLRVTQQNFFTESLDVRVYDYPYDPSPPTLQNCGDCGQGKVRLLKATGDDYLVIQRGGCTYQTAIPTHLEIPKCDHCGATYFGQTDYNRVSAAMGADSCKFTSY